MLHSLILLLNYIALIAVVSYAKDTLLSDEVLSSDGRHGSLTFLESQNKLFRLQFLRQQGTQNYLYLGIQYMYGANAEITIWVSNANEIFSGSLFLKMDGNGQLIVGDGSSDKLFVVNNKQRSAFNNTSATLRDDGNLVLTSPNSPKRGHICWQSFEHPGNVFFPGMKLGQSGTDTQTPSNRVLTSWISEGNPSPGAFSLGMNPDQPNELIIKRGGDVYWRSGEWNRRNFTFLDFPAGSGANMTNYANAKKAYFSLSGGSQLGNKYSFIRLNSQGGIDVFIWNATTKTVEPLVAVVCDPDEALRRGVARSGGCSQPQTYGCGGGEWFNQTTGSIIPEALWHYLYDSSKGLSDCQEICRRNCSCYAYTTALPNGTACKFSSSRVYHRTSKGEIFYFRIGSSKKAPPPASALAPVIAPATLAGQTWTRRKHMARWKLAAIVSSVVAIVIALSAVFLFNRFKRRRGYRRAQSKSRAKQEVEITEKWDNDLPLYNLATIKIATDNFSRENMLGQGGFGVVYLGKLANGDETAVKRMSKLSGLGIEQFHNEIVLIAKLQHRNLVKILGCCMEENECILIYEYLPNKSLDSIIFDPTRRALLCWKTRINIIQGIAQGLLYLHTYSRLRVIHRDLKVSNILLDKDMNPKISDFGIAKIFGDDVTRAITQRIIGTYGYMSPEYAMDGRFSVKSDVFSFGIMTLEIISGKKNIGFYNPNHVSNLIGQAWQLWCEGKAIELVDFTIHETVLEDEATRYTQLGLLCVQEIPEDRPDMSDVISMIMQESTDLPIPRQPAFSAVIGLNKSNSDCSRSTKPNCSSNEVTISRVQGR